MGKLNESGVNWVICGQCTPKRKSTMPKIEWIHEIVTAADKAGIPVFLKDNLETLFKQKDNWYIPEWAGFNDWNQQEIGSTLRQEFPR